MFQKLIAEYNGGRKAAVRMTIQQSLDALPPAYEDSIWADKVGRTYQWVFARY